MMETNTRYFTALAVIVLVPLLTVLAGIDIAQAQWPGYRQSGNVSYPASVAITGGTITGVSSISSVTVAVSNYVQTTSPNTQTGATYTVAATDNTVIANRAGTITMTLPTAASFTGRSLRFVTIQAQTVISDASNVVPLAGGAAGTAILPGTAGKWADLQSNGTNWVITASN